MGVDEGLGEGRVGVGMGVWAKAICICIVGLRAWGMEGVNV